MLDKYSSVLLKIVTGKELSKEENIIISKEFYKCLQKASENRIEFFFLKTIKYNYPKLFKDFNLHEIYKEGEVKRSNLYKTISLFQEELNNKDYAIIKTLYPFPTIPSDIDILFFDDSKYDDFVKKMVKRGFFYIRDDERKGSLKKSGIMKCEPHQDITWHGLRFVSKDFIKKNLIKETLGQSSVVVPNKKAAFLISAAHILFDCQYVSLRDYLVLEKSIEDQGIIEECFREAEKFGWRNAAEYLVQMLHNIKQLSFPVWIPIIDVCSFFKNKLIFDFRERKENNFSAESVLMPFIYYFWKRLRSKFSRRIYRNSWLY